MTLREAIEQARKADPDCRPVVYAHPGGGTGSTRHLIESWLPGERCIHEVFNPHATPPGRSAVTFRYQEALDLGFGPFFYLIRDPIRHWTSASLIDPANHALCGHIRPHLDWRRCEGPIDLCLLRSLRAFHQHATGLHLPTFRVEDLPPLDPDVPTHYRNSHLRGLRPDYDLRWVYAFQLDRSAATYLHQLATAWGYPAPNLGRILDAIHRPD